jgi:hypothetical protein
MGGGGDLTEDIHSHNIWRKEYIDGVERRKIKKKEIMMMKGPGVFESDTKDGEEKGLAKL